MAQTFESVQNHITAEIRSKIDAKIMTYSQLGKQDEVLKTEWENLTRKCGYLHEKEEKLNNELTSLNRQAKMFEGRIEIQRNEIIKKMSQVNKIRADFASSEEQRCRDVENFEKQAAEIAFRFRNAITTYSNAELSRSIEEIRKETGRVREEMQKVEDEIRSLGLKYGLREDEIDACSVVEIEMELNTLKDALFSSRELLFDEKKRADEATEKLEREIKRTDKKIANLSD